MTAPRVPHSEVHWRPCYRIIPSRFPPIDLFERVADPADLEAVIAIESMTNDRLRAEAGEIDLVPPGDRITGPGAGFIMGAFTRVSPAGGRFTDGTYGAYYAARDLDTAIAETVHHRERFLAATREPPMTLDMRVLLAELRGRLHDLRGAARRRPALYAPDDYAESQAFARALRERGSNGIVWDSVRREGGECAAVFRPPLLSRCRQGMHLAYVWDGTAITEVYEKRRVRRRPPRTGRKSPRR